jgi:hypothetical protein
MRFKKVYFKGKKNTGKLKNLISKMTKSLILPVESNILTLCPINKLSLLKLIVDFEIGRAHV